MLPTYLELVKISRKQQRHIKWRKFLCRLGIHTWKTTWQKACIVWCGTPFSQPVQTDGTASIEECRFCPTERGILDNGLVRTIIDPDYIRGGAIREGLIC